MGGKCSADLETGNEFWERQVHKGRPETAIHLKNSFASETPVTDGEQVYCYFGNVGIFAFDFEGQEVWKRETAARDASRLGNRGVAGAARERIYWSTTTTKTLTCWRWTKTGKEDWRTERDEKSNWATPFVWENGHRTEIVTPGTGQVRSYDLDGKVLWSLQGMSSITIATPYEYDGLLISAPATWVTHLGRYTPFGPVPTATSRC